MSSSRLLKGVRNSISPILYCDKGYIVLQKPPGLICQLNHSNSSEATARDDSFANDIAQRSTGNVPNDFRLGKILGEEPVPVHRLDKELLLISGQGTTGALVLARSVARARALSQQFQAHTVEKTYLALVRGGEKTFPVKSGEVRTPIQYDDGRASLDLSKNGKPSITEWAVIASSPLIPLSLLRLKLHTGHKHQLRVHLAHSLGAPILGDTQYSRKPISDAVRKACVIPENRTFLHASHLSFFQYKANGPKKRFRLGVTAPLPSDFFKICHDAGIKVDSSEVEGGIWIDGSRVEDGLVPDVEGSWMGDQLVE
ncbi:hypothetical protein DXG01_003248 [Tephrocybe rancida]|nr:hypothetical protein DXG01_003248 [Tephrocybe rancida]